MDLTPKQQVSEAIRQAESILIITGQRPNIDQIASVVALALILRKFGKKVSSVVTDQVPASAAFFTAGHVEKNLHGLRDFIIKVDLSRAEVDKLKYTIDEGKLNVHVVPFKGGFSQADVSYEHGDYHYDLIIAMGVPSRIKLDRVLEQNPGLLNSTPLVNIDYHRINESYGAINLVDTNAATLSEMLISVAESLQAGLLDDEIATAMLAGIIASTDRFSAPHTTAKSMTVAAQLMAAGAKQQTIIKALFGSRDGRDRDNSTRDRDNRDRRDNRPQPNSLPQSQPTYSPRPAEKIEEQAPEPVETIEPISFADDHADSGSAPEIDLSALDWNSVMPKLSSFDAAPSEDEISRVTETAEQMQPDPHFNPNRA
ncbi:MAG: bifunctional oligoribonuclease/PAP phosphatase NrnA [Candidatus Saccharimonadia bacterium]